MAPNTRDGGVLAPGLGHGENGSAALAKSRGLNRPAEAEERNGRLAGEDRSEHVPAPLGDAARLVVRPGRRHLALGRVLQARVDPILRAGHPVPAGDGPARAALPCRLGRHGPDGLRRAGRLDPERPRRQGGRRGVRRPRPEGITSAARDRSLRRAVDLAQRPHRLCERCVQGPRQRDHRCGQAGSRHRCPTGACRRRHRRFRRRHRQPADDQELRRPWPADRLSRADHHLRFHDRGRPATDQRAHRRRHRTDRHQRTERVRLAVGHRTHPRHDVGACRRHRLCPLHRPPVPPGEGPQRVARGCGGDSRRNGGDGRGLRRLHRGRRG